MPNKSNGKSSATDLSLEERIRKDAEHFDQILSYIPPKYYFPNNEQTNNKWNRPAKPGPKQAIKEATKKAKRLKLDPANYKTVVDIQKEMAVKKKEEEALAQKQKKLQEEKEEKDKKDKKNEEDEEDEEEATVESEGDDEAAVESGGSEDEEDEKDEEEEDDDDDEKEKVTTKPKPAPSNSHNVLESLKGNSSEATILHEPKKSLEELRGKLRERIEDLRKKRKSSEADLKKRDTRPRKMQKEEEQEEKKQLRKERKKKKRQHLLDNKKAAAEAFAAKGDGTEEGSKDGKKKMEVVEEPVDDSNLQFGLFDFSSGKPTPTFLLERQKRKNKLSVLLQKAEAQKKLLQELKGTPEGEEAIKSIKYDAMMKRAKGEKVKDNPTLLKKTLKRKQKSKEKSAVEWESRKKEVKRQQEGRQKKRQENIEARLEMKKNGKGGKKKAGGAGKGGKDNRQKRAGFEGKKKQFLNKGKK